MSMEKQFDTLPLKIAAFVMALTFIAHLFMGSPELYSPLRASDIAREVTSPFSVIWHYISLHLLLLTVALWGLARRWNAALFWFVLVSVTGFGVMFIAYGINDMGSIWPMPQWIAFLGVAGLMLLARGRA